MNFKHLFAALALLLLICSVSATPLPNVIGVYWDPGTTSSPTLSYIASDNSTPATPDFNTTYPWSQMGRVNNSATQYQTMVWIPAFYYSSTLSGTIHKYFIYTGDPASVPYGFSLHPAFLVNGTAIPGFYFSAFEGSNYNATSGYNTGDFSGVTLATDKLSSVAGSKPTSGLNNSITLPQFRSLAQHRGTGWELQTFNQISAIELLFYVEYHSFYAQSVLSQGVTQITDDGATNMAVNTGATAGVGPSGSTNLGNTSGQVTIAHYKTGQTTYPLSYRGVENLYGNIWKWTDGINIKSNNNPWIASYGYNSTWYASPYVNAGVTLLASNDWVTQTAYSSNLDYGFLPSVGGGSSSTGLTDYYYQAAGDMAALFGGSWNLGLYCGPAGWALNHPESLVNPAVGGRISYVPSVVAAYTHSVATNTLSVTDTSYTVSTISGVKSTPTSWNWSFGDGQYSTSQNPSHTYSTRGTYSISLNASTSTDSAITMQSIFVGTPTGFNRVDLQMTQRAILTVVFKDSSTGEIIPVVTVVDSNGYTETTVNGIYTHTYDYGTVILYFASAGYRSKSASYLMSGDRSETVTLTSSTATVQNTNVIYQAQLYRFIFKNLIGTPLGGLSVTIRPVGITMPTNWTTQFMGISPSVNITEGILSGTTGSDGSFGVPLLTPISYQINISGTALSGDQVDFSFIESPPSQGTDILISLPTSVTGYVHITPTPSFISYNVYNQTINATSETLSVNYHDPTGSTNLTIITVVNQSGYILNTTSYSGAAATNVVNNFTYEQEVSSPSGDILQYGFSAYVPNAGGWNNITETITFNQGSSLTGNPTYDGWAAIIIMVLASSAFAASTVYIGTIGVGLMGLFFYATVKWFTPGVQGTVFIALCMFWICIGVIGVITKKSRGGAP